MTKDEIVDDVHRIIMTAWSEEERNEFFLGPWKDQGSLAVHHYGLGTWIRNHYLLWNREWVPELVNGVDHSPYHPDNMSMTIIWEVWKRGMK